MVVARLLPTPEAYDLIDLTRDVADRVLDPIVDQHERDHDYPKGVLRILVVVSLTKTNGTWLISALTPCSPVVQDRAGLILERFRWILAEANHPPLSLVPTLDEARQGCRAGERRG